MLASLHLPASSPRLYPPTCCAATASASTPSTGSCGSRLFVGLKPYSTGVYGDGRLTQSAGFQAKVHRSLRIPNKNATRGRVSMMPMGVPRVPYKTPGEGTPQWIDLWNALYRERVICIGKKIDEESSNMILATMLYLDSIDSSKKIYLYLNCPGGDLTPTIALYDTMQSLKSSVGTHCLGFVYNLAGLLLAGGDKGSRTGMPLSRIYLQTLAGAAYGQADDIRNEATELLRVKDILFNEIAKKTGQPFDKISKDLSRVKRFTASEAVEYGLIDRIVRPSRIEPIDPSKDPSKSNTGLG